MLVTVCETADLLVCSRQSARLKIYSYFTDLCWDDSACTLDQLMDVESIDPIRFLAALCMMDTTLVS